MAARRVAKSAVNWAAFSERVPPNQVEPFRRFKAKSDHFVSRVHALPEKLPQIDWAFYKARIAVPGMVDSFEKAYQGLKVTYPKDKNNVTAEIDKMEKDAMAKSQVALEEMKKEQDICKHLLTKLDELPPIEQMTHEMYAEYFPQFARNADKPRMFPFNKNAQPGHIPGEIN